MTAPVVVEHLVKRYGDVAALRDVSFEVRRGEIFGLLGPNGAGKTTAVEILEGLRPADGGSVRVAGIDVAADPRAVKGRIGVLLQGSAFPEHFLAAEVVELFGLFHARRVDVAALLAAVGLRDKAKTRQDRLSGGQRQRLAIAAALVNAPEVLFLDEPTTGLDPQARRSLWELITGLRERGTTIVLTTHYLDEAELLCDRVAIIDEGRIVALDTPRALIGALLARGFTKPAIPQEASLEDVFLDLTGHGLREE